VRYQPEWVGGKTVGSSRRDAAGRYAAIAAELQGMYGFSVLDLGAYAGYFSLRLADEFGARVVAVDDSAELAETMSRSPHPGVTGVFEKVDAQGLSRLDVVLCLSVLHHVPWWRSMIDMLIKQSKILFVETADPRETLPAAIAHSPEIPRIVEIKGGRKIHESPGFDAAFLRPTYVIRQEDSE
jgi:2-polyprenyl-3-methyl-5-hydroxy-6-metoxy-1,4-benzoquinol methylase